MGDSDRARHLHLCRARIGQARTGLSLRPRETAGQIPSVPPIKEAFGGVYIANEGFTFESATAALADGVADAVAFGKLAIANPDLPQRFAEGAPLNAWDKATFYAGGAKGYTDYPAMVSEQV